MKIVKYKKTQPDGKNTHWAEKKKIDLIKTYLALGNLRASSAIHNIPYVTVQGWKTTQWWKDIEEELRRGANIELSSSLRKVVSKALVALEDRVQHGDYQLTKSGNLVRKPMSGSDLTKTVTQLTDKAITAEKQAFNQEKVTDEGLDGRLTKLREEMIKFAKAKTIQGEVINVVPVEPVQEPVQEESTPTTAGSPTPSDSGSTEPTNPSIDSTKQPAPTSCLPTCYSCGDSHGTYTSDGTTYCGACNHPTYTPETVQGFSLSISG